jgi:3-oxoacyl-[acyl-carrier protein] reductase
MSLLKAGASKCVIVTGGSRGLGLGIARKLRCEGYCVVAIARKETSQLTSAMQEDSSGKEGSIHFVPFDLARIEEIAALVRTVRKNFGPIYGLVNNAAISFEGALSLMHDSRIEQLVRVNTLSPIILTKCVLRSMMVDGAGRIVNVASIIAFTGYSGLAVYGATKASMIGFTRSLAREAGRMGVNVNSVAPGFVDTDMTQGLNEDQRGRIIRRSALGRLAQIDDVANAVEFLLSDKAKNITGTVVTVDAGSTA